MHFLSFLYAEVNQSFGQERLYLPCLFAKTLAHMRRSSVLATGLVPVTQSARLLHGIGIDEQRTLLQR